MKEKINQLQQMISAKDPQAFEFLQSIVNEAKTEEDKRLIDELAQSLLLSANQTLDTLEEEVAEYSIRQKMGNLAEAINFAFIAREYFGKSRSWLYHKIKGDIVNGKPASFTPGEKETFYNALNDIKSQLSAFTQNA